MRSPALLRRRTAAALAVALAASAIVAVGPTASAATPDRTSVSSYAPDGTVNVARAATVSASSAQAAWLPSRLIDDNPGTSSLNVWVAGDVGPTLGGWAQLDFAQPEAVQRVVVFPRGDGAWYGGYYPVEYTASLFDGSGQKVWSRDVAHADAWNVVAEPDVLDLEVPVTAVTLRIDVTKRSSRQGGILQLSELAAFAESTTAVPEDPQVGGRNLALGATATASSSYEMPGESWAAALARDGVAGNINGWSTSPYDRVTNAATPATLTFDLNCTADVDQVAVFPRESYFPRDYRVQVSSDGQSWATVGTSTGNPSAQQQTQRFDLPEGSTARYVRLHVDVRNGPAGADGYLAQISEMAVYGERHTCLEQLKPALLMPPGAVDDSWFTIRGPQVPFTASSTDPAVATIDANGVITATGVGTATVTLATEATSLTVPVEVSDDIERIGDKFSVTVFWPPTADYVTAEQYDNLAAAGIDVIQNAQGRTAAREVNHEMARLAHERGMQIIVQDDRAGAIPTMSADAVKAWAKEYTNIPGVGGLYLIDEPQDATSYATAFRAVREVAPEYYPHLNFHPYWRYGTEAENDKAMQDWLDASGERSIDDPDYLMYDLYPFQAATTAYEGMFTNLNTVRELGLDNTVKTAMYLQSVGIPGALRRPVPAEIRYEANLALAYGYKKLSYFTWWTPTGQPETFTDAIMTADGRKTDLYEPITQLNAEIHALGPTLMRLDAEEVYLHGTAYGQPTVPADFFVQSEGDGDLVLSKMVDRENGEEYLFVVNNSFSASQDVELSFDETVGSVREISRADGAPGAATPLVDGRLTRELAASEGVLYLLEEPVAPDKVKPVATLVTPATSGPFTSDLALRVDATDDRGLQRIVANIYRDGVLVKSTQTAAGGARAATHVAHVTLPGGTYTIRYNASDLAGNIAATGSFEVTIDAVAPTVTIKDGATDAQKSFKLYDAGKIDRLTLNGVEKDLVDNAWSDLNFVRPGVFGAVEGANTLVVYDRAGNATTVVFELVRATT